jgi:hypothetical protein
MFLEANDRASNNHAADYPFFEDKEEDTSLDI